jgi:hypothetical protein
MGWQVLAILVVLFGLPSATFLDVALAHDWYFGSIDARPALLSRQSESERHTASSLPSAEDGPEVLAPPRGAVAANGARSDASRRALPAALNPRALLPHSTGPPRA